MNEKTYSGSGREMKIDTYYFGLSDYVKRIVIELNLEIINSYIIKGIKFA